jgi:hypothetical protein
MVLLRGAQPQFGVFRNILGQVHNRPVGLTGPAQGRGRLAGQQHNLGLALRTIAPRRGAVRAILQPSQPFGRKAGTPVLGGMPGDAQRSGNLGVRGAG